MTAACQSLICDRHSQFWNSTQHALDCSVLRGTKCVQPEFWDLGMHPENVYHQCNANHNQQAGIGSLQDKRAGESLCLGWTARTRSQLGGRKPIK